jgi:hypothetical protein
MPSSSVSDSPAFRVERDEDGLVFYVRHRLTYPEIAALLYGGGVPREELASDGDALGAVALALGIAGDVFTWNAAEMVAQDQDNGFDVPGYLTGGAAEFREFYAFCATRAAQLLGSDSALIG